MTEIYYKNVSELNNDGIFRKFYENSSDFRKKKADRMMMRKDKNLSVGAAVLLDKALSDFGFREKDMKYVLGENGKPHFEDVPYLHFNVSHSEENVMVCISDREVGCDIEKIKEVDFKIAERFFTTPEYGWIMAKTSEQEKTYSFFEIWTLKEAIMKATGLGMKLHFDSFSVVGRNEKLKKTVKIDRNTYKIKTLDDIAGYVGAIAVCM